MKNLIVLLIVLIGVISISYGQEISKPVKNKEQSISVSATKMNILYRGVDNPISICVENIPSNELSYTIEGDGHIIETTEALIINNLRKKQVLEVSVCVFKGKEKNREKIGEQVFRVKYLPEPDVFVRRMNYKNEISKDDFLSNPYLLCELPEYVNFYYPFTVTEFDMVFLKDDKTFHLHSNGNKLSIPMIEYVKALPKNTSIIFKNIQIQYPNKNKTIKSLSAFSLTLK